MWENPATQRNVAQLVADGVQILGPASGEQACGEVGAGRMLEPAEILDAVIAFFTPKLLAGKQVLITLSHGRRSRRGRWSHWFPGRLVFRPPKALTASMCVVPLICTLR